MRSLLRTTLDDFRGRLRGFGAADLWGGTPSPDTFTQIAATGANCVRMCVIPHWTDEGYTLPPEQVARIRVALSQCQALGLRVVLLAALSEAEQGLLWTAKGRANALVRWWSEMAASLRGRLVIAGFDFLNEPTPFVEGLSIATVGQHYWDRFVEPAIAAVRKADPLRICVLEAFPHATCETQADWGEWMRHYPGTVASTHLYSPHGFTHAKVADWAKPWQPWDGFTTLKAQAAALLPLRDWCAKTGQPGWVGEMSANQAEPGGAEWAAHACDLLHGYELSGSWHFFHGDPRWHPNAATMQVLQRWFRRR